MKSTNGVGTIGKLSHANLLLLVLSCLCSCPAIEHLRPIGTRMQHGYLRKDLCWNFAGVNIVGRCGGARSELHQPVKRVVVAVQTASGANFVGNGYDRITCTEHEVQRDINKEAGVITLDLLMHHMPMYQPEQLLGHCDIGSHACRLSFTLSSMCPSPSFAGANPCLVVKAPCSGYQLCSEFVFALQ